MNLELNQKTCRLLSKAKNYDCVDFAEYEIDGKKATVLDFGAKGAIPKETATALGILAAEASMGTLGKVKVEKDAVTVKIPKHPAIATLSCQLAGWAVEIDGKKRLGSGPARILAQKPKKITDAAGYEESSHDAALVLETGTLPGKDACRNILEATQADNLVIAAFKDDTTVGIINVLARIVEVGIFRLHNLGYDAKNVVSAEGCVPMIAPGPDAMFCANDAIIYGGKVALKTKSWQAGLELKAVSMFSPFYGKTFKDIYDEAGGDFYKIDAGIFAPASLEASDLANGLKYHAGKSR